MLAQTRATIDNMVAAGVPRKDFSVRTVLDKNGNYGESRIVFYGSWKNLLPSTEKLSQYFHVVIIYDGAEVKYIHISIPTFFETKSGYCTTIAGLFTEQLQKEEWHARLRSNALDT